MLQTFVFHAYFAIDVIVASRYMRGFKQWEWN